MKTVIVMLWLSFIVLLPMGYFSMLSGGFILAAWLLKRRQSNRKSRFYLEKIVSNLSLFLVLNLIAIGFSLLAGEFKHGGLQDANFGRNLLVLGISFVGHISLLIYSHVWLATVNVRLLMRAR